MGRKTRSVRHVRLLRILRVSRFDGHCAIPLDFARWAWFAEKWRVTSYHKRNFSKQIDLPAFPAFGFPNFTRGEREGERTFFNWFYFTEGAKSKVSWFYSGIGNSWTWRFSFDVDLRSGVIVIDANFEQNVLHKI